MRNLLNQEGNEMANAGIDYGMGTTNVNVATGIHYGVISQHDVSQAWCDSSEAIYPEIETEYDDNGDEIEQDDYCSDLEPTGYAYSGDGYELVDCLDSDIMVLASPFYTFARFCSPCVPGAGNLNDAGDEDHGVMTYCLGHDWFEDGKAPYPVYSVETGKPVEV